MKKRKKTAKRKAVKAPKIKRIVVPRDVLVKVVTPPGTRPVVATDPTERVVEIIPVPYRKSWWNKLFD